MGDAPRLVSRIRSRLRSVLQWGPKTRLDTPSMVCCMLGVMGGQFVVALPKDIYSAFMALIFGAVVFPTIWFCVEMLKYLPSIGEKVIDVYYARREKNVYE